jgi:hypothetical protein
MSSSLPSYAAGSSQKPAAASGTLPPIERQLVVPKDPIQQFFEKRESEPNPFVLPNEDVFLLREKEREEKNQTRARNLSTKIWDKHRADNDTVAISQVRVARSRATNAAKKTDCVLQGRRREKENMADFIAKKRETFLIQMALDSKKQEIQKLEDRAHAREDTLRRAEIMLEDDAMRFDAFLKDNDRKAHQALQRAELETKEKQDKALQVRRLVQAISKVESDILKADEQLKSCLKYKNFLDSRTPPEHFDRVRQMREAAKKLKAEVKAQRAREKEAKRVRRAARAEAKAARVAEKEARAKAKAVAARARASAASGNSYYGGMGPERSDGDDDDEEEDEAENPEDASSSGDDGAGEGDEGDGDDNDDDEEDDETEPMYFTRPEQLLDAFTQLEERNLFLIQSVQETEEAVDETRRRFKATKEQMQTKTELLEANINDLKAKIAHEQSQANSLWARVNASSVAGGRERLLAALTAKVREVYSRLRLSDSHTDPVDMLREVERHLEHLLTSIQAIARTNRDRVLELERQREGARRARVREARRREMDRQTKERLAIAMARAKAEVVKRVGKQVMFRSAPVVRRKKEDVKVERDEEAEEYRLFFMED